MRRKTPPRRRLAGPPPGPARGAPETSAPGAPATRTASALAVPVALGWEVADGVLVMTATTPSLAASFEDRWSMSPSVALTSATVLDASVQDRASYVSRAAVTDCALAHDTTYTFSYSLVMRTGGSAWVGSGSVAVTVGPDGSLTAPDGSAGHARG